MKKSYAYRVVETLRNGKFEVRCFYSLPSVRRFLLDYHAGNHIMIIRTAIDGCSPAIFLTWTGWKLVPCKDQSVAMLFLLSELPR